MNRDLYTQAHEYFAETFKNGSYYGEGYYNCKGVYHYGGDRRMIHYFQHECEEVYNILGGNLTSKECYSYRQMLRETEEEVTPDMLRRCVTALKAYTHTVRGYYIPGINQLSVSEIMEIYYALLDALWEYEHPEDAAS